MAVLYIVGTSTKQTCSSHFCILPNQEIYRRVDKPGLWAALVEIDGETWHQISEAPIWQGTVSGMLGERTHSGDELSALKFGFPSMVQLPEGEILTVFWCLEDGVHNIRWIRLRVS